MREERKLEAPAGAIWIRGERLKERMLQVFRDHGVVLRVEELDFIFRGSHTLAVKINGRPEKYIAIENGRKRQGSHPDYFIHVYQLSTGAAPLAPWGAGLTVSVTGKIPAGIEAIGSSDVFREGQEGLCEAVTGLATPGNAASNSRDIRLGASSGVSESLASGVHGEGKADAQ